MGKTQKIILILVLVIVAVVAVVLVVNNNKSAEKKEEKASSLVVNSDEDLTSIVEKLYDGKELPNLDTNSIDVQDKDMVNAFTGLEDGSDLEYLVVSEPLMSSQAYSLVVAKVSNGNADKIAKKMADSVNPAKWICVSAEKIYATSSGDIVFLIMSSEEWAKPIYNDFKEMAGTVGKEYEKSAEDMNFDMTNTGITVQ